MIDDYYIMKVNELVDGLNFVTIVPYSICNICTEPTIQCGAKEYLLNFYGEGNGSETQDRGEYTVEFTNGSIGYITYEQVTKEEFDVVSRFV